MAELHVIGTSNDRSRLLLGRVPEGPAEFELRVTDRLSAAVRAARSVPTVPPGMSPRQIQAELRAGASVDDVAERAGVPVERLEPFAGPVLSELARVLQDALAARMSRPQLGLSTLPLGAAVQAHLARVADARAPRWSTRRSTDASWVVELRYDGAAGPVTCLWRWDRAARSLAPLDAGAAELGHLSTRVAAPPAPAQEAAQGGLSTAESSDGAVATTGARTPLTPTAGAEAVAPAAAPTPTRADAAPSTPAPTPTGRDAAASTPVEPAGPPELAPAPPQPAAIAPPPAEPAAIAPPPPGEAAEVAAASVPPASAPSPQPPPERGRPADAGRAGRPRPGKRPAVPAWADVLLGTAPSASPSGSAHPTEEGEEAQAAG